MRWRGNFGGLGRTTGSRTEAPTRRRSCNFKVNTDKNTNEGYVEQQEGTKSVCVVSSFPKINTSVINPNSLHVFTYLSFLTPVY